MTRSALGAVVLLVVGVLLLPACLGGSRPPAPVSRYTLEYPPPTFPEATSVELALQVERFSATGDCSGWGLTRRPAPFRVDVYELCRWAGSMAELVTDRIYRDASRSGLFRRVVSPRAVEEAPLAVAGEVEEFWEAAGEDGSVAVVGLAVTLEDRRQDDPLRRVVLQRRYREEEPMAVRTPEALAAALSRALERLSRRLLTDLHETASRLPR